MIFDEETKKQHRKHTALYQYLKPLKENVSAKNFFWSALKGKIKSDIGKGPVFPAFIGKI